jgi:uncharacterized protein DUF3291
MGGVPLLAQVNVARMRDALDSPRMGAFLAAADPLYRLAEESPGFVWRLRDATGGHRPVERSDGDGLLVVNLSLWASYDALHAFTYRSAHGGFVRRRSEWFLPTPQPSTALWWVGEDDRPTADEGLRRLAVLRHYGPSPRAFSVRKRYDAAGRPARPGSGRPPAS